MAPIDRLPDRLSVAWRYAILGGLASIPLTVGLYWLSGAGNDLSLNMVFVGGVLAGNLAHGSGARVESVGFRAGLIGGLPGLWILAEFLHAAAAAAPAWPWGLAAVGALVVFGSLVFVIAGAVGLVGAKIGAWLAAKGLGGRLPVLGG